MADIEIGMEVNTKIYLHPLFDQNNEFAFEVGNIEDLVDTIDGCMVMYKMKELNGKDYCVTPILVIENGDQIREAMSAATGYKTAALKAVEDLLEE